MPGMPYRREIEFFNSPHGPDSAATMMQNHPTFLKPLRLTDHGESHNKTGFFETTHN
jgi:hypothetical protein